MLGDTWRPLDCVFCNNQPQNPPIFSCKAGHLVCSSCYGVLLHQIDAKKIHLIHLIHCKLCNAEITNTRNFIAELLVENASNLKPQEALLPKLKTISSSDSSSESTYLSNRGSKPRSYNGLELPNTSDNSSMLNVKSASRRPICCPEYTCRHMVAVASLVSHFEFEHPRALKLELVPDVREDFVVSSDIFNQTYYYLIALLLVGDDHETRRNRSSLPINKKVQHLRTAKYLPVALLCAMLKFPIKGESEDSGDNNNFSTSLQQNLNISSGSCNDNCEEFETTKVNNFIILWASTLDTDSTKLIRCTIEISDFDHKLLYRFHGGLNSIRDSQEPSAIFIRGNCLVIPSVILSNIMNQDEEFIISVVIHYDKNSEEI